MESNTFATSTYIDATPTDTVAYLRDLRNLDEWTLYSRMIEQVDENTWRGTASGYQHDLYYHARPIETPNFSGVEWHCGYKPGEYFQCYPAILFPASYLGSGEPGGYFHWLSFVGPARRTPMIMQGIHLVHTAEIRSLKATLERRAGRHQAAGGRYSIETNSIFVDAPLETCVPYLSDVKNFAEWSYFIRPNGHVGSDRGTFHDEYDREVEISATLHDLKNYAIIEYEHTYRQDGIVQRNLLMLVPCSYAFGDPEAHGCIQHRVAFFPNETVPRYGKLQLEDYGAESMSVKRRMEQLAGNLDSFGKGMSYMPRTAL